MSQVRLNSSPPPPDSPLFRPTITSSIVLIHHSLSLPGIFFKYDLEPIHLTLQERTTSFYHFLVRLVGVVGGVWTCTSFALRTIARVEREAGRIRKGKGRMREGSVGGFLGSS